MSSSPICYHGMVAVLQTTPIKILKQGRQTKRGLNNVLLGCMAPNPGPTELQGCLTPLDQYRGLIKRPLRITTLTFTDLINLHWSGLFRGSEQGGGEGKCRQEKECGGW